MRASYHQGSHFSDSALSTFESLVLEAQLESAHQALELQSSKRGTGKRGSKTSTPKHHQMPFEDHQYISTLAGNDKCADCGAPDTEWASVSFGIVLCTQCSGGHRALGTHVSRVRSIKMDSWTDNHIKAMRLGGNKKCRNYLQKHGLDLASCSIQERYSSPVAQKYHQKLKKQIKVVAEKHPALSKSGSRNSLSGHLAASGGGGGTRNSLSGGGSNHSRKSLPSSNRSLGSSSNHSRISLSSTTTTKPSSICPPRRSVMGSSRSSVKQPKSLSASCPTIVYLGRSFKANNPEAYCGSNNNEETLRISDELDIPHKLEQMWYGTDDDNNPMSGNQSYASTSLSSSSMSRSSFFGGISINNYSNVAELTIEDMHSLQHDTDVKEYVRQQLLKQWKTTTTNK